MDKDLKGVMGRLGVVGKGVPGRENSLYKGPEVETCWVFKGSMRGPVWLEGGSEGKRRER